MLSIYRFTQLFLYNTHTLYSDRFNIHWHLCEHSLSHIISWCGLLYNFSNQYSVMKNEREKTTVSLLREWQTQFSLAHTNISYKYNKSLFLFLTVSLTPKNGKYLIDMWRKNFPDNLEIFIKFLPQQPNHHLRNISITFSYSLYEKKRVGSFAF